MAVVDGGFQTISRRGQQKRDPEQRGSSIRILEQVAQHGQRSKRELVVRGGGRRRERPGVKTKHEISDERRREVRRHTPGVAGALEEQPVPRQQDHREDDRFLLRSKRRCEEHRHPDVALLQHRDRGQEREERQAQRCPSADPDQRHIDAVRVDGPEQSGKRCRVYGARVLRTEGDTEESGEPVVDQVEA